MICCIPHLIPEPAQLAVSELSSVSPELPELPTSELRSSRPRTGRQ